MTNTMKLAAAFMVAAALAGCAKDPISSIRTENPDVTYDVLFNRHGCEIGRFYDNGHAVYTTICPDGGTAKTDYTISNGKTSTHYHTDQVNSPYMTPSQSLGR